MKILKIKEEEEEEEEGGGGGEKDEEETSSCVSWVLPSPGVLGNNYLFRPFVS